jgi:hypothetical protein
MSEKTTSAEGVGNECLEDDGGADWIGVAIGGGLLWRRNNDHGRKHRDGRIDSYDCNAG